MSASPSQAIAVAKRLRRTLASAPDPRLQARAIYSELAAAEGWSPQEQQAIDRFGVWLNDRPQVDALRARCDHVLGLLSARNVWPRR